MDWDSVLRSALIGAAIGGGVGLVMAIFMRKKCPHCDKSYRPAAFGPRKKCPHCGGKLNVKKGSTDSDE